MIITIFTVPTLIIIVVIRTLVRPEICFEFGLSINCRPSPLHLHCMHWKVCVWNPDDLHSIQVSIWLVFEILMFLFKFQPIISCWHCITNLILLKCSAVTCLRECNGLLIWPLNLAEKSLIPIPLLKGERKYYAVWWISIFCLAVYFL
jgi:hypothetical protein